MFNMFKRSVFTGKSYFFNEAYEEWMKGKKITVSTITQEERKRGIHHSDELQKLIFSEDEAEKNPILRLVDGFSSNFTDLLEYCEKTLVETPLAFVDLCLILGEKARAKEFCVRTGFKSDLLELINGDTDMETAIVHGIVPIIRDYHPMDQAEKFGVLIHSLIAVTGPYRIALLCQIYAMGLKWDALIILLILYPHDVVTRDIATKMISTRPRSVVCSSSNISLPLEFDVFNIKMCSLKSSDFVDTYRILKLALSRYSYDDTKAHFSLNDMFLLRFLMAAYNEESELCRTVMDDFLSFVAEIDDFKSEYLPVAGKIYFLTSYTLISGLANILHQCAKNSMSGLIDTMDKITSLLRSANSDIFALLSGEHNPGLMRKLLQGVSTFEAILMGYMDIFSKQEYDFLSVVLNASKGVIVGQNYTCTMASILQSLHGNGKIPIDMLRSCVPDDEDAKLLIRRLTSFGNFGEELCDDGERFPSTNTATNTPIETSDANCSFNSSSSATPRPDYASSLGMTSTRSLLDYGSPLTNLNEQLVDLAIEKFGNSSEDQTEKKEVSGFDDEWNVLPTSIATSPAVASTPDFVNFCKEASKTTSSFSAFGLNQSASCLPVPVQETYPSRSFSRNSFHGSIGSQRSFRGGRRPAPPRSVSKISCNTNKAQPAYQEKFTKKIAKPFETQQRVWEKPTVREQDPWF